ncbi:MAG: DUF262 domain-containing protein [Candidatus Nanohaloarchaea archaeon]
MKPDPKPKSINKLLGQIDQGEYVIPHFQRDYEWGPGDVCDLFNSIIRDYYTGTLLLWDLNKYDGGNGTWDPLWGMDESQLKDEPSRAILDGQQRLSSLYYAIYSPNELFPSRKSYYYFFLDMDNLLNNNYEEIIDYEHKRKSRNLEDFLEKQEELIERGEFPLLLLSDEDYLSTNEFENWLQDYVRTKKEEGVISEDVTALKVQNELRKILQYKFSVETLEYSDVQKVCDIFTRINQKGMSLSTFDLMNAFLFPHGIELRKEWEDLENEDLKSVHKKMGEYILKLMSLRKQKYCSSKYLYNLIPESESSNGQIIIQDADEFRTTWKKAINYAEKARQKILNTGKYEFGALKNSFIPNTTILPVLGALIWEYETNLNVGKQEFNQKIETWYWSAVFSGDYSGSSDTIMAKDYEEVVEWLEGGETPERVKNVDEEFIEGLDLKTDIKDSRYKAVLGILGKRNSSDFYKVRNLGAWDVKKIDDHHIFPSKIEGMSLPEEEKNSIANRTLILDETNKKIQNKRPSKYLDKIRNQHVEGEEEIQELMKSHLVNRKALEHLENDNFQEFTKERGRTLKNEIKELVA